MQVATRTNEAPAVTLAPTDALKAEVAKFRRHLRRYPAGSEIAADIRAKLLNPILAELARREGEKVVA